MRYSSLLFIRSFAITGLSKLKALGSLQKPHGCVAFCLALAGVCGPTGTAVSQTKTATTTTLTVASAGTAVTSVTAGSVVTLTATVTAGGAAVKLGQVNFCDASAAYCTDVHLLGMAQLTSAGTATLTFRPGLGSHSHSYKAVFPGTNTYAGSASGASALTVTGTPGPIATSATIAESGSWGNYSLTATVTEAGQTTALTGTTSFLDASNGNSVVATGTLGSAVAGIGWPNPKSINLGYDTSFVLVADLNGDGIPDLVVNENPVVIYLGKADGTYTEAPMPPISGPALGPMAIADFNGDGIPDLAVATYSPSSASILLGKGDGTFAPPIAANLPSAATNVSQLLPADFNGDGIPDLVVVDNYDSVLAILLGNGDGAFTEASTPPFSGRPTSVAAGDFNGDGKTDLAVAATYGDSITILLGNGDGTFTAGETLHSGTFGTETGGLQIAAADFNADGKLDLAVAAGGAAGTGESVTILTGNGDGTFNSSSSGQNPVSSAVTWIQVADFNQDGAPDVVLADSNGTATVLLNNGSGSFSESFSVVTGLKTASYLMVGVGDLNGDGYPDIAAAGYYNNTLGLYLTEPTETATASANVSLPAGLHQVDASYAGDSNYNASVSRTTPLWGVPSSTTTTLTLTTGGTQVTSVKPGTVVTLTAGVTAGTALVTAGQVNFCDASATHCTDIHLLGTATVTSGGTATFKFLPGAGAHTYKAVFVENGYGLTSSSNLVSLTVGPAPNPVYTDTTAISLSGFPADYTLTATVVGYGGTAAPTGDVSFLDTSFGNTSLGTAPLGTGTSGLGWLISQTPAAGGNVVSEVTSDFNNDGIPDVALLWTLSSGGTGGITILFGNGDGTFKAGPTTQVSTADWYSGAYMIAGDFNGDGKADLAVLYNNTTTLFSSYVDTYLGNGDGTFGSPQTGLVSNQGTAGGDYIQGSMVTADFNGDGKLDLGVVGDYVSQGGVSVLLGNGDGTFSAGPPTLAVNEGFALVASGDFNGDGIPDLVAIPFLSGNATVFLGKGDGTFTVLPSLVVDSRADAFPNSVVAGDFNGDGILDLAFGDNYGVSICLGNGDGTFNQMSSTTNSSGARSLLAGEFNHDGKVDLAAIDNYYDQVDLYIGAGDGTFAKTITVPQVSLGTVGQYQMVSADFNGDGVPDLALLASYYADAATILLTEPTETATATVTGIAPVGAGTHNVEASYAGDSNYGASVSSTVALTAGLTPVVISPAGGAYSSVLTVTMNESIHGAMIYYSASGPLTTAGFVPYTGPIPLTLGGVETITAYATETGYQQSNNTTATFTLNFPIAPTPVISPAGGSFAGPQTVTISDSVAGATIYYTTDGTVPTFNSAVYTGPITVSTSETVAAIAAPSGYSASNVASAQYFIGSSQSSFIYTIAGSQSQGFAGDGGLATVASLNGPLATVLDSSGNLYIADAGNNLVRRVAAGTGIITTVAGTGIAGYSGDNGPATGAQLYLPCALAVDSAGNVYIADTLNRVVRLVAAGTGTITTVAGSTTATSLGDNGPATSAQLSYPEGLTLDSAGNLYIADQTRVRKVTVSTGIITTVAGSGNYGYTGDNGAATSATLSYTEGLAVDTAGNLYITDTWNNAIRKVTANTGIITTVAGTGPTFMGSNYGGDGGAATSAHLYGPRGVAVDAAGNLYISDSDNFAVREVTASNGIINTIAGHPLSACTSLSGDGGPAIDSAICYPAGVTLDSAGNLYIAESGSNRIRKVTVAAAPPTAATATPVFSLPTGTYASTAIVSISDSTPGAEIYVTVNGVAPTTTVEGYHGPINVTGSAILQVLAVAPGYLPSAPVSATYTITTPPTAVVSTVAGNGTDGAAGAGGPATNAEFRSVNGLAFDSAGNLYIADPYNGVVWMVAAGTGTINIVAGTLGTYGNSGNGGPATSALLDYPTHVALDPTGNVYIADSFNSVVRKVEAQTGIISVYAGGSNNGPNPGDGGPATSAFLSPQGLAFDGAGNLYIADTSNSRIRMVSASTGIINTVAGGGTSGALGDGGPATSATLSYPVDLALDSQGNLYVADAGNGRIRVVNAGTKAISTLAGNGNEGEDGDGGPATSAEIFPYGIALDGAGNLYIANLSDEVRMVPAGGGAITTVAGSGYTGFGGDGGSATVAELCGPEGLAFDKSGSLYIADWCNYRVRKITFPGPAATPTFSLAAGTYTGTQTLTITDTVSGAAIFYTTDGSTPNTGSTAYSGPITVSSTETVKAIAVATGYTISGIASAAYIINVPVAPVVTWATPAAITYGTPLSSAQLDATTTVAGSFVYYPLAGTVLNAGQQTLTATFRPTDTTDYTSSSAGVTLTVNPAIPSVSAVASSLNPSMASSSVTFSAAVTSPVGTPSGTVTFLDGTAQLGSGALTGGTATFTTSGLSAGSHTITAAYSGDQNFASVTGAPLAQIVESFSIVTPGTGSSSATVSPGGQANFSLLLTPPSVGTALTFAVTGLPAGATGTFSPSTVAAGSGPTTVTLTVNLPSTSAKRPGEGPFRRGALPIAFGMILLPIAGRLRKLSGRSLWFISLWLVAFDAAASISACGGGAKSPSNPQTYTLTVTASSGSLTQSTKLTLTVE